VARSEWSSTGGKDEATAAGGAMLLRESVVELQAGSVLAGRFQIRRVLGKGATGVVLEADDRVSRSLVALKVFKPEIASDDRWQEIVGSELRHARQIMHPNVCRVFDAGEADGYRFLSMEYASGGSLRQRLKSAPADRPFEEKIADARAVVQGLAAIHAAGLIHRDVKPDNVLIMEDGRPVLTDFGLAIAPGQATFVSGYSGAVGTPSYMAPEVALGGDASMASDVFSLGVILHEIFFARRPEWETTKRGRFLRAPVEGRSARRLRYMARLCAECLDDLAPRRPQSAVEVSRSFERAAVGRSGTILGALRAGKWGLATGLVLAGVATSTVLLLSRPKDGVFHPRLVGTPKDWSGRAALVGKRSGRVRCLSVSGDGKTVRLIWDLPTDPVEVDAESGQSRPWNILPETYASARCPAVSPDGRRLAFTSVGATSQIMLSPNPDGSGARSLTNGDSPQWHPNGQELIYFFDSRRVGVVGDHGVVALLPETAELDQLLMSVAISPAGDRLATVHVRQKDSLVVLHDFPSLKPSAKFRLEIPTGRASFSPEGKLLIVGSDGGILQLLEVESDERISRHARMGSFDINRFAGSADGVWFATDRRSATLFEIMANGRRRELARSQQFRPTSTSSTGDVVLEEILPGGQRVIGLYSSRGGPYQRITKGPVDSDPLFRPGEEAVVFVDRALSRIRLCSLAPVLTCRTLVEGEEVSRLAGFSPTGDRLAFFSLSGSRSRLRVISLRDEALADLALGSPRSCKVRWPEENRLWIFRSEQSEWTEMDVASRAPTGRTEKAGALDAYGCPVMETAAPTRVVSVSEGESALWFKRN
jgi:WD40 repeat protein